MKWSELLGTRDFFGGRFIFSRGANRKGTNSGMIRHLEIKSPGHLVIFLMSWSTKVNGRFSKSFFPTIELTDVHDWTYQSFFGEHVLITRRGSKEGEFAILSPYGVDVPDSKLVAEARRLMDRL